MQTPGVRTFQAEHKAAAKALAVHGKPPGVQGGCSRDSEGRGEWWVGSSR